MREGWSKRKIEEIATITMGQSPSGNSINETEGVEFHQGKIYFGELTFYPASGMGAFVPEEWDEKLGRMLNLDNHHVH